MRRQRGRLTPFACHTQRSSRRRERAVDQREGGGEHVTDGRDACFIYHVCSGVALLQWERAAQRLVARMSGDGAHRSMHHADGINRLAVVLIEGAILGGRLRGRRLIGGRLSGKRLSGRCLGGRCLSGAVSTQGGEPSSRRRPA